MEPEIFAAVCAVETVVELTTENVNSTTRELDHH